MKPRPQSAQAGHETVAPKSPPDMSYFPPVPPQLKYFVTTQMWLLDPTECAALCRHTEVLLFLGSSHWSPVTSESGDCKGCLWELHDHQKLWVAEFPLIVVVSVTGITTHLSTSGECVSEKVLPGHSLLVPPWFPFSEQGERVKK